MSQLTQQEIDNRIEFILDRIAEKLILLPEVTSNKVIENQKTIRNGIISIGRQNKERLVLFQKDIKANEEDLGTTDGTMTLTSIVQEIPDINQITISVPSLNSITLSFPNGGGGAPIEYHIENLLSEISTDGTNTILNPLNISQFISIQNTKTNINPQQANEFLDTNIYELLPDGTLRQQRIDAAFAEIRDLLPPTLPDFGLGEDGRVNRNQEGDWVDSEEYYLNNSITAPQENPNEAIVNEEEAYITRLVKNENNENTTKSIESLRNQLNEYLNDVDEQPLPPSDDRPEYQNESDGYLKFRNLNQGIIIRNTNSEFIEGLNPNSQDYLQTGFTITMWVRFLDQTSQGTLFNFGNPTRNENPFGFKLETYVIDGDEPPVTLQGDYLRGFNTGPGATEAGQLTWKEIFQDYPDGNGFPNNHWVQSGGTAPNEGFFSTAGSERFVRLVVKEADGRLRGSHVGKNFMKRRGGLPDFGQYDYFSDGGGTDIYDHAYGLMTNTLIPQNFTEWYFICATYNPNIDENGSHPSSSPFLSDESDNEIYNNYNRNSVFWQNNINPDTGVNVVNSNYGARCKVEIISRSDLLRARGYKV